jgi:hypothetical protein
MADVDVGLVADLRFSGGTSTALINEIKAIRRCGLSCALVFTEAPVLARSRPPCEPLCAQIAASEVPVLPAGASCTARLLLVHHPALALALPARRCQIRAPKVALVAHHPAVDRGGQTTYDYVVACRHLRREHDGDPIVLPVGPAVRRSLRLAAPQLKLHPTDWHNLICLEDWPQKPMSEVAGKLIFGRHSRPGREKWPEPELARTVYPERPDIDFAFLGIDEAIHRLYDPWPTNWQGLAFRPGAGNEFLQGLDAYSYYHSATWTEAFGYNVLEALATGLPTVLPPHFEETFGAGPIYAMPAEVPEVYDRLVGDSDFRRHAGNAARAAAQAFDIESYGDRISDLLGPGPAKGRLRPPERPDTTLIVTSNGVGTGHLSRQIAIAKSFPIDHRAIFFTLSSGASLARSAGFLAEHRPFHRHLGIDADAWNAWFWREMSEALQFYRPQSLVFDGNMPYQGLLDALGAAPEVNAIWVRRGMWRSPDPVSAKRSNRFDLVIEPGELAETADPMHARAESAPFVTVAPVLSVPRRRRLSRSVARRLLGLPADRPVILLALGAGSNFDMEPARKAALDTFADIFIFEPINSISAHPKASAGAHHIRRAVFPLAMYLSAFDGAISAAGYNSFHELVSSGIPTVFVPNEAPEMDLQEMRADYAERCSWAQVARAYDPYGLRRALQRLRDRDWREEARGRMTRIETGWDGAEQAAGLITLSTRRRRAVIVA